jgi:hypothetical protein
MAIRWFKHGKLSRKENDTDDKFTIVKLFCGHYDKNNFENHRFFIGFIEGDWIYLISKLSETESIEYTEISLKRFKPLTPKDIINIKLGNAVVTLSAGGSINFGPVNCHTWKYANLTKVLGGEEKIEFYQ